MRKTDVFLSIIVIACLIFQVISCEHSSSDDYGRTSYNVSDGNNSGGLSSSSENNKTGNNVASSNSVTEEEFREQWGITDFDKIGTVEEAVSYIESLKGNAGIYYIKILDGTETSCSELKKVLDSLNDTDIYIVLDLSESNLDLSKSSSFGGSSTSTANSSLLSVILPDSCDIGTYAFRYCESLLSVYIPEGITSIGTYAFAYCKSLKSINIPKTVISIGTYAFYHCESLISICVPESVENLSEDIFCYCTSLTEVLLPSAITIIPSNIFYHCDSLVYIMIPSRVTTIESGAFEYCMSLKEITIPAYCTYIGKSAFYGCSSLESAIFEDPSDWYVDGVNSSTSTNAHAHWLLSSYLEDPSTAAIYLTEKTSSTVCNNVEYEWIK